MQTATQPIHDRWMSVPQRTQATRTSLESIEGISEDALITFYSVDWFNAVHQFRAEEADYLCQDGQFESTLDEHRAAVAQLIALGETLVLAIKKTGLVKGAKFSIEDVRAVIESLRETFRGVHGPHNHPAISKNILKALEAA
ncbi:MAG TPA: hypothetical protein VH413_19520 [Verrucomicrobiae bacterium]|jgi:hypothetical protein|nr:hypothetical protein [Verrucomicrobiae bacterium]